MHLQSDENKSCFPQKTELQSEIDELRELMQFSKRSYSRVILIVHFEIGLKVKNYEGRDNGALQHKVWDPEDKG